MEPYWINKEDCLSAHDKLLSHFGGLEGVRDDGMLEPALSRPEQLYHYEKAGAFELAASYAYGIIKNHPFIDGNKRTGYVTCALFLSANGWYFDASEVEVVAMTLALASGEISEDQFSFWLEENSRKNSA